MKLAIAADHAAYLLKQAIKESLKGKDIEVEDCGTGGSESVDYPDYAAQVAERVSSGQADAGVLACGTGIGMSIVANKFKNVRAAVVFDEMTAKAAKEHNNANVLCLGGRVKTTEEAKRLVEVWLNTRFEGGRHQRRLEKISAIEKKNLR